MSAQQRVTFTGEPAEVDAFYLFGCMTLWRKTGNIQAGWELTRALASSDPEMRSMAEAVLCVPKPSSRVPVLCTVYVW
jgi:hypothetical protein